MAVAAVITVAAVSAGSAYYQAEKQEDAAAEARRAQEKAASEAEARSRQVMLDSVSSESATTKYGTTDETKKMTASQDLLIPRQLNKSLGSSNDRVGLGF